MLERDLADLIRTGWRSLAMGMIVLAISICLSQAMRTVLPGSAAAQLIAERPRDLRLGRQLAAGQDLRLDIWAARRRLNLYRRLLESQVELRPF